MVATKRLATPTGAQSDFERTFARNALVDTLAPQRISRFGVGSIRDGMESFGC